jgi:hypothetical protein
MSGFPLTYDDDKRPLHSNERIIFLRPHVDRNGIRCHPFIITLDFSPHDYTIIRDTRHETRDTLLRLTLHALRPTPYALRPTPVHA